MSCAKLLIHRSGQPAEAQTKAARQALAHSIKVEHGEVLKKPRGGSQ